MTTAYPAPMTKGADERVTKKLQASSTEKTRIARKMLPIASLKNAQPKFSVREREQG